MAKKRQPEPPLMKQVMAAVKNLDVKYPYISRLDAREILLRDPPPEPPLLLGISGFGSVVYFDAYNPRVIELLENRIEINKQMKSIFEANNILNIEWKYVWVDTELLIPTTIEEAIKSIPKVLKQIDEKRAV